MIDMNRTTIDTILSAGSLPVSMDAPHPRAVMRDVSAIVKAAAHLGHEVEVGVITNTASVSYIVSPRAPTGKECMKAELAAMGHATYTEYVQSCIKETGGFNVSHMGTTRRQAHGRIRYALAPRLVTLSKLDRDTTRVEFIQE